MALTNSTFNTEKISIYCCLSEYMEEYRLKRMYTIKDCKHMQKNLRLAAAMFDSICRLCLDNDDENYSITNEELEQIISYIKHLL